MCPFGTKDWTSKNPIKFLWNASIQRNCGFLTWGPTSWKISYVSLSPQNPMFVLYSNTPYKTFLYYELQRIAVGNKLDSYIFPIPLFWESYIPKKPVACAGRAQQCRHNMLSSWEPLEPFVLMLLLSWTVMDHPELSLDDLVLPCLPRATLYLDFFLSHKC
jgi:hypothetical protein